MTDSLNSILLLTILLAIGLFFFLRASSKDRTTVVEITSSKKPIIAFRVVGSSIGLEAFSSMLLSLIRPET